MKPIIILVITSLMNADEKDLLLKSRGAFSWKFSSRNASSLGEEGG